MLWKSAEIGPDIGRTYIECKIRWHLKSSWKDELFNKLFDNLEKRKKSQ